MERSHKAWSDWSVALNHLSDLPFPGLLAGVATPDPDPTIAAAGRSGRAAFGSPSERRHVDARNGDAPGASIAIPFGAAEPIGVAVFNDQPGGNAGRDFGAVERHDELRHVHGNPWNARALRSKTARIIAICVFCPFHTEFARPPRGPLHRTSIRLIMAP